MKHFICTIVCFSAIAVCQPIVAGQSLVAYQGNSHVHLLLFDTDNPKEVLESVLINPDSDYHYLGNATNIAYFDSPPKMLAYAVKELLAKLSSNDRPTKKLVLDHFGVFVAGYEAFAHQWVCTKADGTGYVSKGITRKAKNTGAKGDCLTLADGVPMGLKKKETFFWETFDRFNHESGQTIEARHRLLESDHILITQAARVRLMNEQNSYELIPDVDVVHLTTCAPGYQVRSGRVVQGSSVSPHYPKDGGFFQVGKDFRDQYLKQTELFEPGRHYQSKVLNAMSSLSVSREYARHRNDSILNRWKTGFFNEQGIALTLVLLEAALPENDEDIDPDLQEKLLPLIVGNPKNDAALQAVAETIRKLENQGHVILPDGKTNRIRLLGEFPWDKLGLKVFFRDELSEETFRRLDFVIDLEYKSMLTIAASYIYEHPDLFDKSEGDED